MKKFFPKVFGLRKKCRGRFFFSMIYLKFQMNNPFEKKFLKIRFSPSLAFKKDFPPYIRREQEKTKTRGKWEIEIKVMFILHLFSYQRLKRGGKPWEVAFLKGPTSPFKINIRKLYVKRKTVKQHGTRIPGFSQKKKKKWGGRETEKEINSGIIKPNGKEMVVFVKMSPWRSLRTKANYIESQRGRKSPGLFLRLWHMDIDPIRAFIVFFNRDLPQKVSFEKPYFPSQEV